MSSATTSPWLATLPHQAADRGHTPDRAADGIPSRAGTSRSKTRLRTPRGDPTSPAPPPATPDVRTTLGWSPTGPPRRRRRCNAQQGSSPAFQRRTSFAGPVGHGRVRHRLGSRRHACDRGETWPARPRGWELAQLPLPLAALGNVAIWSGDCAGAASLTAEAESVVTATGSRYSCGRIQLPGGRLGTPLLSPGR